MRTIKDSSNDNSNANNPNEEPPANNRDSNGNTDFGLP